MADEPSNELKFEVTLSESRENVTQRTTGKAMNQDDSILSLTD